MTRRIVDPDWTIGPDACQGDLCITRLDPKYELDRSMPVPEKLPGAVVLLEGDLTGHNHAVYGGTKYSQPAMFRDDGIARRLEAAAGLHPEPAAVSDVIKSAGLYRDDGLMRRLVSDGLFTRADLHIGFLLVEGGSVVVEHPEHDGIRLPEGLYYIGRQVESVGAEERRVQD